MKTIVWIKPLKSAKRARENISELSKGCPINREYNKKRKREAVPERVQRSKNGKAELAFQ